MYRTGARCLRDPNLKVEAGPRLDRPVFAQRLPVKPERSSSRGRSSLLTEPGFEGGFAEPCLVARNERSLAEFRSGV